MNAVAKADNLAPLDALVDDVAFWQEFRLDVARAVTPLFLNIYVAGYQAAFGLKTRRKAEPGRPDQTDAEALLDPEFIVQFAQDEIMDWAFDFSESFTETTYETVRGEVAQGRERGLDLEEIIERLKPLFGERRAELVGVTETTRLFGVGAQASYRAQGINGWEWMEVNDPWVCQICAGLAADSEAEPFPISQAFSPAHPRCRCFPAPALIDESKKQPAVAAEESIFGGKYKNPEDFVKNATNADIEKLYSPPGYKARLIGSPERLSDLLNVQLEIRDLKGNDVAFAQRQFYASKKDIHHDLLAVEKGIQGKGFAVLFNKRAEKAYRELGFETVSVLADIDVGKYAWARQGFDFERPDEIDLYRYKLSATLINREKQRNPSISASDVIKIVDKKMADIFDGAVHSWDVAGLDDGELWPFRTNSQSGEGHLGKHLMLDAGAWRGVKQLDPNSESQRIGNAYFSKVKD